MKKFRRLKIHTKFQKRCYSKLAQIPEIRLEGKWLSELGFKEGKMVRVEQRKNKLIITVDRAHSDK